MIRECKIFLALGLRKDITSTLIKICRTTSIFARNRTDHKTLGEGQCFSGTTVEHGGVVRRVPKSEPILASDRGSEARERSGDSVIRVAVLPVKSFGRRDWSPRFVLYPTRSTPCSWSRSIRALTRARYYCGMLIIQSLLRLEYLMSNRYKAVIFDVGAFYFPTYLLNMSKTSDWRRRTS